jgi:hypothetical protein
VELTRAQFDQLWPGTQGHRLTKTRYDVPLGKHIAEVDVYRGKFGSDGRGSRIRQMRSSAKI